MWLHILVPGLAKIRARYPDLDIMLNVTQANLNLARSDADIALRLAEPEPDTGLVAFRVAALDYHLYASRDYMESRKAEDFQYIGYPTTHEDWLEHKAIAAAAQGRRFALRTNHLGSRITATRSGIGISLLPRVMAEIWPELVQISDDDVAMQRTMYLIVHETACGHATHQSLHGRVDRSAQDCGVGSRLKVGDAWR
ncbi:MAG: LysR substrate-binding domain-containing protein [Hyphomicrobiaceae bacterium]